MSYINFSNTNSILERKIVKSEDLLLDKNNPRFFGKKIDNDFIEKTDLEDAKLQEYLRQQIYEKFNINDLINSIIETGFLKLDPIIVTHYNEYYKVVEGNRRLAAIKTIIGNIKRKILEIPEEIVNSLYNIEVTILNDSEPESKVWVIQGIRHVSGIQNWGSFQQAELINSLYNKYELSFKKIGSIIGLSPQRVSTILKAYYGIQQMMNDEKWCNYATPELFSHFEQAYSKSIVKNWLSWDNEKQKYLDKENLHTFYYWITHRNEETQREKLRSVDIRDKLPTILENEEARNLLIDEEANLDEAYNLAVKDREPNELNNLTDSLLIRLKKIGNECYLSNNEKKKLKSIKKELERII